MFETEIIRIPILPLGMVNAHLIKGEAGCILVDAGMPTRTRPTVRRPLQFAVEIRRRVEYRPK